MTANNRRKVIIFWFFFFVLFLLSLLQNCICVNHRFLKRLHGGFLQSQYHARMQNYSYTVTHLLQDLCGPFQPEEKKSQVPRKKGEGELQGCAVSPYSTQYGLRPWKVWHHIWRDSFCFVSQRMDGVWLGAWSHCGTTVVFFQFLSDHMMRAWSGIQQRLGMRPCWWEVLSFTAGPLLYHCLSFVVTGSGFGCLYMMWFQFQILCQGKPKSSFTFLYSRRKTVKLYE